VVVLELVVELKVTTGALPEKKKGTPTVRVLMDEAAGSLRVLSTGRHAPQNETWLFTGVMVKVAPVAPDGWPDPETK
jgi:hypothetical protein